VRERAVCVLALPRAVGGFTGKLHDAWQIALEDIGPAGADTGKGSKYLLLPPGYIAYICPLSYVAQIYSSFSFL
jgi:hypothetical protein